jgi:hypothetical protein
MSEGTLHCPPHLLAASVTAHLGTIDELLDAGTSIH